MKNIFGIFMRGYARNRIIFFVAAIGLVAPSLSSAESQRTLCANAGVIAKSYAEQRNNGVLERDIASRIEQSAPKFDISPDEAERMKFTASLVYGPLKTLTPMQISKLFYTNCMKANGLMSGKIQ